ncbi:F-box only protein 3 [Batrachochytrium dendrobatidis]
MMGSAEKVNIIHTDLIRHYTRKKSSFRTHIHIQSLPPELLLLVFSFLQYIDVLSCAQTCWCWHAAASHSSIWLRQCKLYGIPLVTASNHVDSCYRSMFRTHFNEYAGFMDDYVRMSCICNRLKLVLVDCPLLLHSFEPPCHISVYKALLKDYLHISSVRQLILLYTMMGIQHQTAPALFGSIQVYQYSCDYRLSEPFLVNDPMGGAYLGFLSGTRSCNRVICMTESLSVYGRLLNICPEAEKYNYDLGEFVDYLDSYVTDIEQKRFLVHPQSGVSLFPEFGQNTFFNSPTEGVSVIVSTTSFGDLIDDVYKGFAYRIHISFDPDSSRFVQIQLQRRSWVFTFKSGHFELISGDGVVGTLPLFNGMFIHVLGLTRYSFVRFCWINVF